MILKYVVISPYAEYARKFINHWLSTQEIGYSLAVQCACAKIGYSLAEHTWKSFWRTMTIFRVFPLFPLSPIHLFPSPVPFRHPLSLLSCLCTLSPILSLLSHVYVPSLTSLFLVSWSLSLSQCSAPCLSSSVPCLTWSVPFLPSSFLCSLTPINCSTCSRHFWWLATKLVPSNQVMSSQSGNVVTCTVNFCCSIARLFMKIWKFYKNMSCLL
jgi:hypothetical protein